MANRAQPGAITVGDKGRVVLSEAFRRIGVSEGDVVVAEVTDRGTIELVPMALVPRDQVWFAHPDVQERMAEAHADIAAGRVTTATSSEDLRVALRTMRKKNRHE